MGFGAKASGESPEDKVQERLPQSYWTSPPNPDEAIEVTKEVGRLEAKIELLKFEIKRADTKAKKDSPRKPSERFEYTEELEEQLAAAESELAKARAAERIINRHVTIFTAYLYAVGKVY